MASRKRRRENPSVPETPIAWTLPADLVLEILSRSEPRAVIRCAATSKLLRREILRPSFIRQASHQAAPCVLAHLTCKNKHVALVHPVTHVAASFCDDILSPFLSRHSVSLFDQYSILVSRRGLILLRRRTIKYPPEFDDTSCSDLCVYDPMSGVQTFYSEPPGITSCCQYVLLTAADGIKCSILLVAIDHYGSSLKVQTASSCGTWSPVTGCDNHLPWWSIKTRIDPAVLNGGIIHWMENSCKEILSYDASTGKTGTVELPPTNGNVYQLHLATSSDGKMLKLLAIERFIMSVWLQLPVSTAGGSGWSLEAVINMEEKLRSLDPAIIGSQKPIKFNGFGKRSGEVVLLRVCVHGYMDTVIVFDLETMEMHKQKRGISLLEIDLPSRLQTMKIFS
ncbi:hypothetical protein QYE76_019593 [Lolium multiflorum]|uniref:DUF7595 domain-containing protein n=1 Tax=Lolium multiflorum TaxID=4521 RepID=A0AAD8VQJ7_LOLMU|nr:hypothetical protein QYE76_019593 [Lolium multiflorum]